MTPDVANYADFYLRRLVHSFEKPYDPDRFGESALSRLTNKLVLDSEVISSADLDKLRDAQMDDQELARLIMRLADDIVASEKFQTRELDINIVRRFALSAAPRSAHRSAHSPVSARPPAVADCA